MRSQTRTPRSGPGHLAGRRRIAGDVVISLPADADALQGDGRPEILSSDDPHDSADVQQPADADGDQTDPAAGAPVVRRRPRLVVSALAICLVAVLAACALVGLATRRDQDSVAGGNAALTAARASATAILSYDYRDLDADFARAAALTTGSFRTDYQATTGDAVAKLATQTQAVVVAQVMAGGIVSSTSEGATVLLFVNQTTTSNRLDTAKVDRNRVELTMLKVGSHWLVSGLRAR
jgi:Mce-associated membrane protein